MSEQGSERFKVDINFGFGYCTFWANNTKKLSSFRYHFGIRILKCRNLITHCRIPINFEFLQSARWTTGCNSNFEYCEKYKRQNLCWAANAKFKCGIDCFSMWAPKSKPKVWVWHFFFFFWIKGKTKTVAKGRGSLNQSCKYRFGVRFGLIIRMVYFGTRQYQRFVSDLPLYIYISS